MVTNVEDHGQTGRADPSGIRRAVSDARDPAGIIADLKAGLSQPNIELVLVFAGPDHDLTILGPDLQDAFAPALVVGSSTAGEIAPYGYAEHTVTAVSFAAPHFHAVARRIDSVSELRMDHGIELVQSAIAEIQETDPSIQRAQIFSMLLIDGLSMAEEAVVSTLHAALDEIPLFGGSAGDGLSFNRTTILLGGQVLSRSAVVLFVATKAPFQVFKTEHFKAGGPKMVVTEANPATRVVTEINAEPAAAEYARLLGLNSANLDPMAFASHPVVVTVGGQPYVRSIQKVNPDGSLTFFCAIDEGIVLTAAQGVDIQENLIASFERVRQVVGPVHIILGCDCILRRLEVEAKGLVEDVSRILSDHKVVGFSTYGEQFQAMHVNQTFTGVAIGETDPSAPGPAGRSDVPDRGVPPA